MLEDIEIFCAVASSGNFSQAARSLNLSPSIVTRRIARLEEQLGCSLMHRSTRAVTLTEAGQRYFDEVQPLIQSLHSANKHAKNITTSIGGTLKIGIPASITQYYLSPHLHTFLRKHPDIDIQIINGNHLLDLLDKGFDMVLHCKPLPDSNFHYKKLGQWEKIICAGPGYLKQYGTPKTPADLLNHNCIDHVDNVHHTWHFRINGKRKDILVSGNICVNSSMDICTLAAHNVGIAYLPSFVVHENIKNKHLVPILNAYRPPPIPMFLVYPSKRFLTKKVTTFIQFLEKRLSPTLMT